MVAINVIIKSDTTYSTSFCFRLTSEDKRQEFTTLQTAKIHLYISFLASLRVQSIVASMSLTQIQSLIYILVALIQDFCVKLYQ